MKYNLLIVEDHFLTRQTLEYQTKKLKDINSIISAQDGLEALEIIKNNDIQLVLMDINMPRMNGIDATKEIKKLYPDKIVIILTAHKEREKVLSAFQSGANGYCVKEIKIDELAKVIDVILEGGIWVDSKVAQYVFDVLTHIDEAQKQNKLKPEDFDISAREKEILYLISKGLSNDEIAEKLFISKYTVKNHVASIIHKFAVKDRAQIAIFAIENKMFE